MEIKSIRQGDVLRDEEGEKVKVWDVCTTEHKVSCHLLYVDSDQNGSVVMFPKTKDGIDIGNYELIPLKK